MILYASLTRWKELLPILCNVCEQTRDLFNHLEALCRELQKFLSKRAWRNTRSRKVESSILCCLSRSSESLAQRILRWTLLRKRLFRVHVRPLAGKLCSSSHFGPTRHGKFDLGKEKQSGRKGDLVYQRHRRRHGITDMLVWAQRKVEEVGGECEWDRLCGRAHGSI